MSDTRSRLMAVMGFLFAFSLPAAAQEALAQEQADSEAAIKVCRDAEARANAGPFAGKLSFLAIPSGAMMLIDARPGPGDMLALADYGNDLDICDGAMAGLSAKYLPLLAQPYKTLRLAHRAMMSGLFNRTISYGEANRQDVAAKNAIKKAIAAENSRRDAAPAPSQNAPGQNAPGQNAPGQNDSTLGPRFVPPPPSQQKME